MTAEVLSGDALDALRTIGDPDLEGLPLQHGLAAEDATSVRPVGGVLRLAGQSGVIEALAKDQPLIPLDAAKLFEAQRLFATFGTEISGALLLAALPQSYATQFGAGVLAANAQLESDLVRRIRQTAQFLLVVMQRPDDAKDELQLWAPGVEDETEWPTAPWRVCTALRIYHEAIRRRLQAVRDADPNDVPEAPKVAALLGAHNDPPLNQEDLLGMLLSFSITTFEVLERYGIFWTADEQDAYLHAWDVIGSYLGIGAPRVLAKLNEANGVDLLRQRWHGLRPPTVDDTRALLEQIRVRQWIDPEPTSVLDTNNWSSVRSGRVLTKALLDELAAAMPGPLRLMPIAVMRTLARDVVRRRLSLGANGVVLRVLMNLPSRRHVVDRFTAIRTPNPIAGRALRAMANEVTTYASMRFLREGDFVIPGLEDWSDDQRRR